MSNDVILDATVEYIKAHEEHLNLAFSVEKAMPLVRKTLVTKVLSGIKNHFLGGGREISEFYTKSIWENQARLILRSKDWPKVSTDDETGVQLRTDASNWNAVYIGLCLSGTHRKKIEGLPELHEKLTQLISMEPKNNSGVNWLMWEWLNNCRMVPRDWSREEFCKSVLNSPEQVVSELTALVEE